MGTKQSLPLPHVHKGIIVLFLVVMLAGNFSLERIDPHYAELGEFGYIRTWGSLLLWIAFAISLVGLKTAHYRIAWSWTLLVCSLHAYLALSALWSPMPSLALQDVSTVLLVAIITTFAIPIFGRSAEQGMTFFLNLMLWAALMYAVAGMATAAQAGTIGRMSALGGGPNVFVRIMCMGIFAAFCGFARAKKLRWLSPIPLLLICAVFSGSRGGLITFAITFSLFMLFVSWKKYIGNYVLVVVAFIPGIMYVAVAYIQPLSEFVQHRFIELTFQQQYGLYESYGRITLLREAWSIFRSSPMVGIGLNGYQQTTMTGLTYSHNLIVQIAAEGGIVGLTIFAGATLWIVFQTHFHKGLEHNVMFFLGLYHLGASMFSGTYYDARWMWFFFVLFLLPANAQHAVPPVALHLRDVAIPEQSHPQWLPTVK